MLHFLRDFGCGCYSICSLYFTLLLKETAGRRCRGMSVARSYCTRASPESNVAPDTARPLPGPRANRTPEPFSSGESSATVYLATHAEIIADSCDEVECGAGKTCAVRKGHPRCICSGKCKDGRQRVRGPICGSDGRTYRNVCRLKKKACKRKFHTDLSLAYTGTCQSSCDKIRCSSGKSCLLDQNLGAHCVKCVKQCPDSTKKRRQVCGSDGKTYPSSCHLRETACRLGKAIPIAYKGPCREGATCKKVQCREQQSCLVDRNTQTPRCVSCSLSCKPRHLHGPICGSNNSTYRSWCHMMQDACGKGYVIETKHSGHCGKDTKL